MKPLLVTFFASFSVLMSITAGAVDRIVTLTRFTDTDPKREVAVAADEQAFIVSIIDVPGFNALSFINIQTPPDPGPPPFASLTTLLASREAWKTTPYQGPVKIVLGLTDFPNTTASAVTLLIVPKGQPFPTPAPVPAVIPTAAVVIPADAVGPVQIMLESSVDMVTWTAATPGTYAASTAQRFFRVRAIQQPSP